METTADLETACGAGWEVPSWEDLVRRYGSGLQARVRRVLRRSGRRPRIEQVEELVQEVYCRLFAAGGRRLRQCRAEGEGQVISYLGKIAERVVIDQLRTALAAKRGGGRLVPLDRGQELDLAERAVDPRGTPEDRLLAEERRQLVASLCRRLASEPAGRRDLRILRLALVEGWSSREISLAVEGELAPAAVDSLVCRLRRRLAEDGIELPRRDLGGQGRSERRAAAGP
ncbi:MAG TPA: sigma-70 family RNA polymerase sigma factor [Thermoanaerobaculia bacterium]|nr:sigma-70 family RNA polymerase sigma factor [Thermoanaerobaculia bacterium]